MKKLLMIFMCLFFLVGCSSKPDDGQNKQKLSSEIKYFSSNISKLLNDLNNISLQNYELKSAKIEMSQKSQGSSSSGGQSSSGGGQSQSGSSGGGSSQSGGQSGETQTISVTDMQSNSILKTNTEDIDWDKIKNQIEEINDSWSVVMLDLHNSNVPNNDIMAFSALLDKTIISIKNEDKPGTLTNLTELYAYIPKFLSSTSAEKHSQNIETTKYHIFVAYSDISKDDWNAANANLSSAETSFLSVLNDTEYSKNREFKVNKTYMLIKDLQNSIANKDKQLFFLKYKNLIESLNML